MSTLPSGKYQLKTLHEDIALFDRKLAHTQNFESFPSENERNVALDKLTAKRSLLIRKAQVMIDEGIEFGELERPKSLRPDSVDATPEPSVSEKTPVESAVAVAQEVEPMPSPYAGTSLDYRADLVAYKKKSKSKTA